MRPDGGRTEITVEDSDYTGFVSVPPDLRRQIELAKRLLEGMRKSAKDEDYPAALDGFDLPGALGRAEARYRHVKQLQADLVHAAKDAEDEARVFKDLLERMHAIVLAGYGKRAPALHTFGFRPPKSRPGRPRKHLARPATPPRG